MRVIRGGAPNSWSPPREIQNHSKEGNRNAGNRRRSSNSESPPGEKIQSHVEHREASPVVIITIGRFRNYRRGFHTVEHRTVDTYTVDHHTAEFRSHQYHREEFRNYSKRISMHGTWYGGYIYSHP